MDESGLECPDAGEQDDERGGARREVGSGESGRRVLPDQASGRELSEFSQRSCLDLSGWTGSFEDRTQMSLTPRVSASGSTRAGYGWAPQDVFADRSPYSIRRSP